MKCYYENLKDLREDHDKTQQEIANIINTSGSCYGQYERGARLLPIDHLITLCNFYKISADYILGIPYDYDRPQK